MNTPLETLLQDALREALTEGEREHMRALLTDYAAFKPIRPPATALPRLSARAHLFARPAFAGALSLSILLLGTGGATYAAEGALPGDLLYPVKVNVTEPMVTVLTPSGRAQAAWQISIAERRLGEADSLSREGRLATSTETMLVGQAADATLRGATDALSLAAGSATTTASTTEALDEASRFLEEGHARAKSHDEKGAVRAFRASIQAAARLEVLSEEGAELRVREDDGDGAAVIEGAASLERTLQEDGETPDPEEDR